MERVVRFRVLEGKKLAVAQARYYRKYVPSVDRKGLAILLLSPFNARFVNQIFDRESQNTTGDWNGALRLA